MGAQFVVGILTPAISFLFAIVFFVFWNKRPDLHYFKDFAISFALIGTGFAQTLFFVNSYTAISLAVCCALGTLSIVHVARAFLTRQGLPTPFKALLSIWIIGTTISSTAEIVFQDIAQMITTTCITAALMFLYLARQLKKTESKLVIDKYIPAMLLVATTTLVIQSSFIWSVEFSLNLATFKDSAIWIAINMIVIIQCCAIAVLVASVAVSDSMTIVNDQAMIDELSGLQRRERFEESTLGAIDKASRGGVPVSLIICDLDHFKAVNDTHGHLAGDEVIKKFGRIMQATARSTDILGRIGGEEFAVLLWNADANGANLVAQQLRSALVQADLSEFVENTKCSASFGVSQWNGKDTYRDLFALADKALYLAKHSGRDCVKVAQAKIETAA